MLFSVVGFMTGVLCQAKMCAICRGSNHTYPRSSSPWAIEFKFAFGESQASLARSPTYGTYFRLARHGRHDSDLKNNIWVRCENSYSVIPELDYPWRHLVALWSKLPWLFFWNSGRRFIRNSGRRSSKTTTTTHPKLLPSFLQTTTTFPLKLWLTIVQNLHHHSSESSRSNFRQV